VALLQSDCSKATLLQSLRCNPCAAIPALQSLRCNPRAHLFDHMFDRSAIHRSR